MLEAVGTLERCSLSKKNYRARKLFLAFSEIWKTLETWNRVVPEAELSRNSNIETSIKRTPTFIEATNLALNYPDEWMA